MLTRSHDERIAPLDLASLEHFTTRSPQGWPLDNLIVRPPAFVVLLTNYSGSSVYSEVHAWLARWLR